MPVIGYISGATSDFMREYVNAFHKGLGDAGYIENINVIPPEIKLIKKKANIGILYLSSINLGEIKNAIIATSGGINICKASL